MVVPVITSYSIHYTKLYEVAMAYIPDNNIETWTDPSAGIDDLPFNDIAFCSRDPTGVRR